jgi:hypothetical protein
MNDDKYPGNLDIVNSSDLRRIYLQGCFFERTVLRIQYC